jgi:molecular chaperone HscA
VIHATEKSLRSPEYPAIAKSDLAPGERERIDVALADLKVVLNGPDRDAIQQKMKTLNEATQHLAEVMMNRSVHAALAGHNVDEL